jgi:glucosyl-3-phosphoglycerate synthase
VTTLHNLAQREPADMAAELLAFSKKRSLGLILPSLFSELEGKALPDILNKIKEVEYL